MHAHRIILSILVALFVAWPVMAQTTASNVTSIDISKLTPEQKAQMLTYAAQLENAKQTPVDMSEKARTEISKWSELGVGMGKAAVSAAKELGVAANEFVETPLGKITMGIVVYKVMGKEIIKMMVASSVFVIFLALTLVLLFRKKGDVKIEYHPRLWGLWHRKVVTEVEEADSDVVITHFIGAAVCFVVSIVAVLNIT